MADPRAWPASWEAVLACPVEPGAVAVHAPVFTNWASDTPWTPAAILAVALMTQRFRDQPTRERGLDCMLRWHRETPISRAPLRGGVSERCLVIWALATGGQPGEVQALRRLNLDSQDVLVHRAPPDHHLLHILHPDVRALPEALAHSTVRWPNRSRLVARVGAVLEAALAFPGPEVDTHARAMGQGWLRQNLVTRLQDLDAHWVHAMVEQEPDPICRTATAVRLVDRWRRSGWSHARSRDDARLLPYGSQAEARLAEEFPSFQADLRDRKAREQATPIRAGRRLRS